MPRLSIAARSREFLTTLILTTDSASAEGAANNFQAASSCSQQHYLVKLSFMLEIERLGGFGNHTC